MNFEQPPQVGIPESNNAESILKKTPEFLAFVAALTASTSAFAEEYNANQIEVIDSRVKLESVDTTTKERFGVSLYDACEQSHCQVLVEKQSQNGKYIILVGQLHVRPPIEMLTSGLANQVAESQEVIYNTLAQLDNPTVIEEGLRWEDKRTVPTNAKEAEKTLHTDTELLMDSDFGMREYQNYIVDKYQLADTFKTKYSYLFSEEQEKNLKAIDEADPMDIENPGLRKNLFSIQGHLKENSFTHEGHVEHGFRLPFYQDSSKSALFALGGVYKLLLDGKKMTVLPGETKTLQDTACEKLDLYGLDSPEFISAQEAREDNVVSVAVQSKDSFPIIVYGAAHNIVNNLDQNNASGYGVIRIKTSLNFSPEK